MFFNSWEALLRILLVGVPTYLGLVLMLRVSGKRTLSKMNAFDLVVTVALGSTLASTLTSKDVAVMDGLTAFLLLIALQFAITWLSVRSRSFQKLIKARPRLLVYQGELLAEALKEERITEVELAYVARDHGLSSLRRAHAVVLETDGSVSVLERRDGDVDFEVLGAVGGTPDR